MKLFGLKAVHYFGAFLFLAISIFGFQNCSKTQFNASAVKGLSCGDMPQPDPIPKRITCPSGVGFLDLESKPSCELDREQIDQHGRAEQYYRYDMSPFYIFGTETLPPNDYSFCGCSNEGEILNPSNGTCSCGSGKQLLQVGSTLKCGVSACNENLKPGSREAQSCPFNSGEIYRSRSVSCNKNTNPILPSWFASTWSSFNADACTCPYQGQNSTFNNQTGVFSCSCPSGQELINNRCQAKAICNNDQEYNAGTNTCITFQCKEYKELSGDSLIVPARDFSKGTCYYKKILNNYGTDSGYANGKFYLRYKKDGVDFVDYGTELPQKTELKSRSHFEHYGADPNTAFKTNISPRVLGSKMLQLKTIGKRALKITGPQSNLPYIDQNSILHADNFIFININNQYRKAYGTKDSVYDTGTPDYNANYIMYNNERVVFKDFESGGISNITAIDITDQFAPNVQQSISFDALDCGNWGIINDVYLILQ